MTERPEMLNQRKKKSPLMTAVSAVLGVLTVLLFAFFAFGIYLNLACFVVEVTGTSMEETLHGGDLLYAWEDAEPRRGDVVIIDVEEYRGVYEFSGKYIIKRLIATGGDSVKCENGVVSVKYAGEEEFTPLEEGYVNGATPSFSEVRVGEGEIFFLGDNRRVSYDSEDIGCLKKENIAGVVPPWAISIKSFSTAWEGFRGTLA